MHAGHGIYFKASRKSWSHFIELLLADDGGARAFRFRLSTALYACRSMPMSRLYAKLHFKVILEYIMMPACRDEMPEPPRWRRFYIIVRYMHSSKSANFKGQSIERMAY